MSTNRFSRFLAALPGLILAILRYILTLGWIREIVQLILANWDVKRRGEYLREVRRGRPLQCTPRCAVIRPDVYRRADPLIYSQRYLMEQGLSVTWNNPDIQLYKAGTPVSSSQLEANTDYEVVATIYNNSTEAPAVGMPVDFSFRSFGIGSTITPVGTDTINLPVKGAPGHPAQAKMTWHTPAQEGHYCLQVHLRWDDDANPKNNLGQENTNVGHFSSPALFEFPVRNEDTIRKRIHMAADAYTIPPAIDCREKPNKKDSDREHASHKRLDVFVPPLEEAADWTYARLRHGPASFPIPAGWEVDIEPEEMLLSPDQTEMVKVSISAPDGFEGEKTFNVFALHGTALIGGVSLTVTN